LELAERGSARNTAGLPHGVGGPAVVAGHPSQSLGKRSGRSSRPRDRVDDLPDPLAQLEILDILGQIVEAPEQTEGIPQGPHCRRPQAGRDPEPGLLADLSHNAIFRRLEGYGQCRGPSRCGTLSSSNLDDHLLVLTKGLGAQVAAIELREEGLGHIGWADWAVKDSSLHIWIIIVFTILLHPLFTNMRRDWFQIPLWIVLLAAFSAFVLAPSGRDLVLAQQPTGAVPTVTGTASGAYIIVNTDQEQINVRGGPSTYKYPPIGVLLAGQQVPALGRSPGGDWIQIVYPGVPGSVGWVYAPLVRLSPGANLQIVEPPPTPTPASTPTIDPTLAAIFLVPETATRLPTYTPPPALAVPTFTDASPAPSGMPIGLLIFGFGFVGALGALISFLRGGR